MLVGRHRQGQATHSSKLLIGIFLLSTSAQAQEYPVSGAWAYIDKNMPGIEVKACAAFAKFGLRKLSGNTVGEIVVFADGKRYDFGGYADTESANLSVQKLSDGSFKVTDRWYDDGEGDTRPGPKRKSYVLRMVDQTTIEISDGRFIAATSNAPRRTIRQLNHSLAKVPVCHQTLVSA